MSDTPLYQDKIYQRQCYQSHQAEVLYVAIHSVYQQSGQDQISGKWTDKKM